MLTLQFLASVLGGLGIYFFGGFTIRTSLQQVASGRLRAVFGTATRHPLGVPLWGSILGAVTQSSIAVSVILSGLVQRNVLRVREAGAMIAWANLGLVCWVFFSNTQLYISALLVLAVTGFSLNFNFLQRYRILLGSLLGLGFILISFEFMKNGIKGLASAGDLNFLAALKGSFFITYILGAALRTIVQSNSAIAVIGIVLAQSGIFDAGQAEAIIFGNTLGTAFATYLLTAHLKGVARQITLFEAIINALASLFMVSLHVLLSAFNLAEYDPLFDENGESLAHHLAWLFLGQQLVMVGFGYLLPKVAPRLLDRLAPITTAQTIAKPQYLSDAAMADLGSALDLVDQEQQRAFCYLPIYLDAARQIPERKGEASPQELRAALPTLIGEIDQYLSSVVRRQMNDELSKRVFRLNRRQKALALAERTLDEISTLLSVKRSDATLKSMLSNLLEGMDANLALLIDLVQSRDMDDYDLLIKMTEARGGNLEKVWENYLSDDDQLSHEARFVLIEAVGLHSRFTLAVREAALSLKRDEAV